ncbi:hypothetical protein [Oryzobacter terrae]|uniref:hypothetical protein n=1 Tax=Oryzobacter terrae TaxID=1620385 RepID=UPI0036717535
MAARAWSVPVGTVVVVLAGCLALLGSGVAAPDVALWTGLVASGVVLPGFVAVRTLRGAGGVAEDVAWSMPLGAVLALATWALGLAVDVAIAPPWTGVAALAALAIPPVRRRVLGRGAPGWGGGSGAAVVGALVVTSAWAWGAALSAFPLNGDRPLRWAPDVMFHTALSAELGRTWSPQYPMVPEPYPYHWFFHALAAHLGRGIEPLVVVTHLLPLTLLLGVVAMAAVAARAVAGHRWGAAAGAVAVGVLGVTQPAAWVGASGITGRSDTDGTGLDPIRLYWQHSATTTLGWLAALGVVAVAATVLRRGASRRDVVLLVVLGVLSAGAKSSQTPVLMCGVGAVLALAVVTRRWDLLRRAGVLGGALVAPWLLALVTIYAGSTPAVFIAPGARAVLLANEIAAPVEGQGPRPTVVVVALALWLLPMAPRLLGLLWWLRRPVDPVGVLCGATVAAGLVVSFLTTHPGRSDIFFLVSAYPVGVVGSAGGLVLAGAALVERFGGRPVLLATASTAAAGAAATAVVAGRAGTAFPEGERLAAWAWPAAVLGAVLLLVVLVVVVVLGRAAGVPLRRWGAIAFVLATVAGLGGGVVATGRDVLAGRPEAVQARLDALVAASAGGRRLVISPALWDAANVVRRSGGPDDVVVTNRRCLQTATALERQTCDPREYTVAALTGRRTGVSGWAYAPTSIARSAEVPGGYARMPFWDPPRLAAQLDLVERPTPERAAAAWARGERWVLADRAAGPVSPRLADIGEVLLDRDGIVLVRLSRP